MISLLTLASVCLEIEQHVRPGDGLVGELHALALVEHERDPLVVGGQQAAAIVAAPVARLGCPHGDVAADGGGEVRRLVAAAD